MKPIGFVLLAVLAWVASDALAQTAPAGATAPLPFVEFRMVKSGQTAPAAMYGDDLKGGAAVEAQFAAWASLCENRFGSTAYRHDDAATLVKMTAELLDQKSGAYSIRLTTQHVRSGGRPTNEAPAAQVLWLRDGDRVTLDVLRDPSPVAGCSTTSVALEARVTARSDLAISRAMFVADLWFVHRDRTGREWNQHVTANVYGTVDTPLLFKDVLIPLPKLDPQQDLLTAYVRLAGTLRARPRADGQIDLDVATTRNVGILLPSSLPGSYGASAPKTLTVRPDETTAIEIPQPGSGFVMTALRIGEKIPGSDGMKIGARPADGTPDPMASKPGVFLSNGAFVLNTGVFFKDHVTRLLIRLRRVQDPV